jgi:hypothetical protein
MAADPTLSAIFSRGGEHISDSDSSGFGTYSLEKIMRKMKHKMQ